MRLVAHQRRVPGGGDAGESEYVVACPQRVDVVSLRTCADCGLCAEVIVDRSVAVVCRAGTPATQPGASAREVELSSIMTSPVVTVPQDSAVENVAWLMTDRHIGAVVVVDDAGALAGILTKTDLLRDADPPEPTVRAREGIEPDAVLTPRGLAARDVMTPVARALAPTATVAEAAAVMAREGIHHLVVARGDRVEGIVSSLDLVRWLAASSRPELS